MANALTIRAASSADGAVKEMEMRYERVSFMTATLLRNIATMRSNGEALRVSGRNMTRTQSRLCFAHGGHRASMGASPGSMGVSPRRWTTARRTASERSRRASLVTMAAASTLAKATAFPCWENRFRIDEGLRRILARYQRNNQARERERERDEGYDEPSVPPIQRKCVADQIFIVGSIIRVLELKVGPLVMIEFERCVHH